MDSAFITVLTNAGVAGVVILLLVFGWLVPKLAYARLLEENRLLREALDTERQRAGEAVSSAGVTNQLIGAIVDLAVERRLPEPGPQEEDRRGKPGLAWKDLS